MDFFAIFSIFLVFTLGLVIGVSFKGININHYNVKDEEPEEYNDTLVDNLDPQVRSYYEQNHGQNKF